MSRKIVVLIAVFALLACAGCGGNTADRGIPIDPGATGQAGSSSVAPPGSLRTNPQINNNNALPADKEEEWEAQWQQILINPGTPNVDYDPNLLTVSYFVGAQVPKGISSTPLAAGMQAADQANAILRKDRSYEALTDSIAAKYGLSIDQQVYIGLVRIASFELPSDANGDAVIKAIRQDYLGVVEDVTYARLLYAAEWIPNDPDFVNSSSTSGPQWGHRRIGCASAWDYTRGDPAVRIAVVDTGVRLTHQELTAHVLDPEIEFPGEELDLANGDNTVEDTRGHGTFIAGLIVAQGNNARTIIGVAPECEVIPIKISNSGVASNARIIAGCLLGVELGAKVINLSWGNINPDFRLRNMVNQVHASGALFVGAAGNNGLNINYFPGGYLNSLCVGSTTQIDSRSSFSNWGSNVDIAAPGQFLKSCDSGSDSDYDNFGFGTSFSAPIVCAAAALLWSIDPDLSNDDIRFMLESTGAPTTGFHPDNPVLRLDLAAAVETVTFVTVRPPEPDQLIHSGTVSLEPRITGSPDRVDAFLDGVLAGTKTAKPWLFEFDTASILFGMAEFEWVAYQGAEQASASINLLVDNSSGAFPIIEDFEDAQQDFAALDVKGYSISFLESIKANPGGSWNQEQVAENGPASWRPASAFPFEGSACYYMGTGDNTYGAYEIDALVSRRLNLASTGSPTAVFQHHFNIEDGGEDYDRAWVYVTADNGLTFTAATMREGGEAYYSGYVQLWIRAEVDLSPFAGQKVHLVLVFESDPLAAGEQAGEPAGWWVDKIVVASNYNSNVPTVGSVSVEPYSVYGEVPDTLQISVGVGALDQVVRVRYILDAQPLGSIDLYDVVVNANSPPYNGVIELPFPTLPNQLANLKVQYFDGADNPGPEIIIPVYIFNLLGDVNADGAVNQADLDAYDGTIGLKSGDPGYLPFFDSDLDGQITEADASAVGYHWGEEL